MSRAAGMTAVLDACVLYPAPVRDFLLSLAESGLYKPAWSQQIQEEWIRNLLVNRKDLTIAQLHKTVEAMNRAFPDANVVRYEPMIESFALPDPQDRHVLAAAVQAKAEILVTVNLKDFPANYLAQFHINVQHPDAFISKLIEQYPVEAKKAFENQVARLNNPPKTKAEVLQILAKCGLVRSVEYLQN